MLIDTLAQKQSSPRRRKSLTF